MAKQAATAAFVPANGLLRMRKYRAAEGRKDVVSRRCALWMNSVITRTAGVATQSNMLRSNAGPGCARTIATVKAAGCPAARPACAVQCLLCRRAGPLVTWPSSSVDVLMWSAIICDANVFSGALPLSCASLLAASSNMSEVAASLTKSAAVGAMSKAELIPAFSPTDSAAVAGERDHAIRSASVSHKI